MSNYAIQVHGIGKKYFIGGEQPLRGRLSEKITDSLKAPFVRASKLLRGKVQSAAMLEEEFWALKDINFDVRHGEVVGVIGANGAGKTTLLKILSRITEPTEGAADLYGRVGSLLEVGTGFHPELTGRENVYLNGAILGMQRTGVRKKFDEIIDFAGIEKFIDTPIKHYSSGMYVRLAFAVAAHLEPEILIVDEVLAVGDLDFQKKSLGKMEDVAAAGRTVLFVSHNMGLINTLCQRGIFLKEGRIMVDGPIKQVVNSYTNSYNALIGADISNRTDRKGQGLVRLVDMQILTGEGKPTQLVTTGDRLQFVFKVDNLVRKMTCNFMVYDHIGQPVTRFISAMRGDGDVIDADLDCTFICDIDAFLLLPGEYRVDVEVRGNGELQDEINGVATVTVVEGLYKGRRMRQVGKRSYNYYLPHHWKTPAKI